jgi:hypothetical protein
MVKLTKTIFLVCDVKHPAYGTQLRRVFEKEYEAKMAICEGELVVPHTIEIEL